MANEYFFAAIARLEAHYFRNVKPDSGHSSHEPGITRELVAATNRIVKTGNPGYR
ncbi:hypothetical protein ACFL3I_11570 [Pseudomonadota bacterium]